MSVTLLKVTLVHSQRTEELLAYYQEVQNRHGQLPHKLYPLHFKFDQVRVRVKVRTERRKYHIPSKILLLT